MGRQIFSLFLSVALILNSTGVYAQSIVQALNLPPVGAMVRPSAAFTPALLRGLIVRPDNPLRFDFIVDGGDNNLQGLALEVATQRMVDYFLAAMVVPENDLWVNLSPVESDRIIEEGLDRTELGRDLLAQDYLLKQLTASLIHPEEDLGKAFWARIYDEAYQKFGTTELPVDTFNKVWIVPQTANVFEKDRTAYITDAKMKVMLESDYLAAQGVIASQAKQSQQEGVAASLLAPRNDDMKELTKQLLREVIVPAIEEEVNQGKNFAPLRQMLYSLVLAQWYKDVFQESVLNKAYADSNKVAGIDSNDPMNKQKIFNQYVEAYTKGVFNFIKEETDLVSKQSLPRQYFSGGFDAAEVTRVSASAQSVIDQAQKTSLNKVTVDLAQARSQGFDAAQEEFPSNQINAFEMGDIDILISKNLVSEDFKTHGALEKLGKEEVQKAIGFLERSGISVRDIELSVSLTDEDLPLGYALDRTQGVIYLNKNFESSSKFDLFVRKAVNLLTSERRHLLDAFLMEYRYASENYKDEVKGLFPEGGEILERIRDFETDQLFWKEGISQEEWQALAVEITGNPDIKFDSSNIESFTQEMTIEVRRRVKESFVILGVMALDGAAKFNNFISSIDDMGKAEEPRTVVFLPSKFAPITIAHLTLFLSTAALGLASNLIVNVSKEDYRKPQVELSYRGRMALAQKVVPAVYGPLAKILEPNELIDSLNGEEVLATLAKFSKPGVSHKFLYMAGGDHFYVFAPLIDANNKNFASGLVQFDKVEDIRVRQLVEFYINLSENSWEHYQALVQGQEEFGVRKFFSELSEDFSRKNFYDGVINAKSKRELLDVIYQVKALPRLDVVGKLWLIQQAFQNLNIVMAHTNRPGENKGDLYRDYLIEQNSISVLNIPGLQANISATQTRNGLVQFVHSRGRVLPPQVFTGNVKTLLQEVLQSPEAIELLLRERKVSFPDSFHLMLGEKTQERKKYEQALLNQLASKLGVRSSEIVEEEGSSTIRLSVKDGKHLFVRYNVVAEFSKSGEDLNTVHVFTYVAQNKEDKEAVFEYLKDLHRPPQGEVEIKEDPANVMVLRQGVDSAQKDLKGGIDMNNMDVNRSGEVMEDIFSSQELENMLMNVEGLKPVIINIVPITNVAPLLGLKEEESVLELVGV